MKKKILCIFTAMLLILVLAIPVAAENFQGSDDWKVTFTKDKKMESNFHGQSASNDVMDDIIEEYLEPGDTAVFTLDLKNEYEEEVDWYMENKILYSLEDRSNNTATAGGGYTYDLVYVSSTGTTKTLFSNANVGGENTSAGEGLWEITHNLQKADDENFFYLDSYGTGQGGTITLTVSLDGESQGNDYQDTLADLGMNFAVEIANSNPPSTTRNENPTTPNSVTTRVSTPNARTGDQANTTIYFVILFAAGIAILLLAIYLIRKRRKEEEA